MGESGVPVGRTQRVPVVMPVVAHARNFREMPSAVAVSAQGRLVNPFILYPRRTPS